jgi:hypothetical protein
MSDDPEKRERDKRIRSQTVRFKNPPSGAAPIDPEALIAALDETELVEQVAEAMAIYAGMLDATSFEAQAAQLLRSFEAIEGRPPKDYLEIETWSLAHKHPCGPFLVL